MVHVHNHSDAFAAWYIYLGVAIGIYLFPQSMGGIEQVRKLLVAIPGQVAALSAK